MVVHRGKKKASVTEIQLQGKFLNECLEVATGMSRFIVAFDITVIISSTKILSKGKKIKHKGKK